MGYPDPGGIRGQPGTNCRDDTVLVSGFSLTRQDVTSPLRLLLVPAHVSIDVLRAQACSLPWGRVWANLRLGGPNQADLHAGVPAV